MLLADCAFDTDYRHAAYYSVELNRREGAAMGIQSCEPLRLRAWLRKDGGQADRSAECLLRYRTDR
jgi:hypothetical protein